MVVGNGCGLRLDLLMGASLQRHGNMAKMLYNPVKSLQIIDWNLAEMNRVSGNVRQF